MPAPEQETGRLARSLPDGIARELEAAAARSGYTEALCKASRRLPYLLAMSPDDFEWLTKRLYREFV